MGFISDMAMIGQAQSLGLIFDPRSDSLAAAGQGGGPLAGATLRVETSGSVNRRITATRLLALGVFAVAAKKKQDDRQVFLTVEHEAYALAVEVPAKKLAEAHRLAAKLNTRSKHLAAKAAAQAASVVITPPACRPRPSSPRAWPGRVR